MTDFLASHSVELVRQPAWSPDFNMLDRYVFASIENARCHKDFVDESDIRSFLSDHLPTICAYSFSTQFAILQLDLEDVINCGGDYISE